MTCLSLTTRGHRCRRPGGWVAAFHTYFGIEDSVRLCRAHARERVERFRRNDARGTALIARAECANCGGFRVDEGRYCRRCVEE